MENSPKSITSLFEENEMRVSRLYSLYSQKIPSKKDFWERLSLEEIAHANAIASAFSKTGQNEDAFEENNFTRGIIRYVSDFVQSEIEKAKASEGISHIDALQIALRVEQSMLEKKCFEIFIPTDQKLKDVLQKLNRDTEEHLQRLKKEFEENQES